MRNTDFFDNLLEKIELLYRKRGDHEAPYIHVATTITYETKEQIDSFVDRAKQFSDEVSVGRTIMDYTACDKAKLSEEEKKTLAWLKTHETVTRKYQECPEVYDKLSIDWDGTVSACCSDYDQLMSVGHLDHSSLKEIWTNSEELNRYRELLADMRHGELELCRTCFDVYV